MFVAHGSGDWRLKVPEHRASMWGPSSFTDSCLLTVTSHGREYLSLAPPPLFLTALIPLWGLLPHDLIPSQDLISKYNHTGDQGFNICIGGRTDIQSIELIHRSQLNPCIPTLAHHSALRHSYAAAVDYSLILYSSFVSSKGPSSSTWKRWLRSCPRYAACPDMSMAPQVGDGEPGTGCGDRKIIQTHRVVEGGAGNLPWSICFSDMVAGCHNTGFLPSLCH